jgi:putative membrane protein
MEELTSFFTERWYVLAFLATFLVVSLSEQGWPRTAFWLVSGTFIGWLMEFSSTRTAFPFGAYDYHEQNFPDELFIAGVPLFASVSLAFLPYFGYSLGRTLLGRLEWRNGDLVRDDNSPARGSIIVLLFAAVLTTWVDTVLDPVTLLGEHWFLGDLYSYHEDGIHFGVPLSNYAGWLFTAGLVLFVNQRFDSLLSRRSGRAHGFHLPFQPLWAVGAMLGNFVFMIAVTLYLLNKDAVAENEALGSLLASGVLLSAAFLAFVAITMWRSVQRAPSGASGQRVRREQTSAV